MSVEAGSNVRGLHAGAASQSGDDAAIRAERIVAHLRGTAIELWRFLRFLPFILFTAFLVLGFWLGVLVAALAVVRFLLRLASLVLLWLSGGIAPRRGPLPSSGIRATFEREVRLLKAHASLAWDESTGPLRRHLNGAAYASRMFWHWHIGRKLLAASAIVFFIAVPWVYLIPRPNDVQISDDNALDYKDDGKAVRYLVHAVDLDEPGRTREYQNEDAWWLGKVNSQGLKSQLQAGRYYRLWVVGIRWWKWPILYPNIIRAQEIDEAQRPIESPSRLTAVPVSPLKAAPLPAAVVPTPR
jgi:hypothetical protein